MIRNEREYRITKAQAEKFRDALATPAPDGTPPGLLQISRTGLRAQLKTLEQEIEAYDLLQTSKGRRLKAPVHEFGELLVQMRTARGWSQRELGERVGLKMQQIQQYEATSYASASLTRVLDIWQALGADGAIDVKLVELHEDLPRRRFRAKTAAAGK